MGETLPTVIELPGARKGSRTPRGHQGPTACGTAGSRFPPRSGCHTDLEVLLRSLADLGARLGPGRGLSLPPRFTFPEISPSLEPLMPGHKAGTMELKPAPPPSQVAVYLN